MRRREFLKIGTAAIPAILPASISAAVSFRAGAAIKKRRLSALVPYLDALLPGESTPNASQLGIHEHLVDHALTVPTYVELLSLGCGWLNGQAGPMANFADLGEAARVRLITLMERSSEGTLERQFFDRTLSDAMQFYYAHPRTWKALGFAGPPQPAGFPDYRQPPV